MSTKPVMVIIGQSSDRATLLYRILERLGISYEPRQVADINAVTGIMANERDGAGDPNYSGCIFLKPLGNADNQSSRFLNAAHDWPICAPYATSCADNAALICGQSGVADACPGGAAREIITAAGAHVTYTTIGYHGTKTPNFATYCTPILLNASNTATAFFWHCKTATSDVYYNNNNCSYGQSSHVMWMWICYYLKVIGVTPPHPMRLHIDIDDIQYVCGNPTALAQWGDILRARSAVSVLGVDNQAATAGSSSFAETAANTDLKAALLAYKDVLPVILHGHTANIWGSDATYATPADKLAAANTECDLAAAGLGVTVGLHHEGYTYLPWNTWTWAGARGLILGGVKMLRSTYYLNHAEDYGGTVGPSPRYTWPIEAGHATYETLDFRPLIGQSSGSYAHYDYATLTGGDAPNSCAVRLTGIMLDWMNYGSETYQTHGGNWIAESGHTGMTELMDKMVLGLMDFLGPDFFRFRTAGELLS
jgi:hypothetical protein